MLGQLSCNVGADFMSALGSAQLFKSALHICCSLLGGWFIHSGTPPFIDLAPPFIDLAPSFIDLAPLFIDLTVLFSALAPLFSANVVLSTHQKLTPILK